MFSNFFIGLVCANGPVREYYPCGGGTLFFSPYVGSGPASTIQPPKNIRNFKYPQKIFEILAPPPPKKKIPHSVHWPEEKTLKCIEIPKYRPILW